jgi:hypothetical protein
LGPGEKAVLSPAKEQELRDAGFSEVFVRELAGVDGTRALQARASWLADHAVDSWWRWDHTDDEQVVMLEEIAAMGVNANGAAALVFEALQDPSEAVQGAAVNALGQLGPVDGGQVQTLMEWVEDEDTRNAGALGLIAVGRADPFYIPTVMNELARQKGIKEEYGEYARIPDPAPGPGYGNVNIDAAIADAARKRVQAYEQILREIARTPDEPFFGPQTEEHLDPGTELLPGG